MLKPCFYELIIALVLNYIALFCCWGIQLQKRMRYLVAMHIIIYYMFHLNQLLQMEGGKRSKALRKFTKLVNVKLLGTEYSHWVNASNFGTSVFQGIKDGWRGYLSLLICYWNKIWILDLFDPLCFLEFSSSPPLFFPISSPIVHPLYFSFRSRLLNLFNDQPPFTPW